MSLQDDLEELESAEDFLNYFELPYDPAVVHVNRLHILQRFHDYLAKGQTAMPEEEDASREVHKTLLQRAYQDFVESNALTEKVFKVFHMHEPQTTFVPLEGLGIGGQGAKIDA
ncbi:nitrogenase-stabilizing/protective protein NifW [Methylogaea oryzae]|uniref:Nitrogenase-stabilizing/protective protein NifW n=1 Tax=Methylogaea oryzae TaxID=1295382 RepID=A0A8D5ALG2_9GAMM|nr:nitrogenase-stabilizing/protective protein NifW [Methylogaea oryzae]BBL72076.1 nitrogenase-stabilizing/protective protein NifW [Methylogaea oryzae]